jgi:Domain of unknown function (DUF4432)
MPRLFGSDLRRDELRRLVGTEAQVAGIRLIELADGRTRGMRAADVYTGSGFRFLVLLDRGLDIGAADHAGRPLAWLHPALAAPALGEPRGIGWLRTFGGGLVTTCGLTHFGPPDEEGPEELGLHGRASHLPAENVRVRQEWRGDDYVLEIEGETCQSRLFGESLRLHRRIRTALGSSSVLIEDRVLNQGFRPSPLAVLYHCSFGYPAVSPGSELVMDAGECAPRDDEARAGLGRHLGMDAPGEDCAEQVFFHRLPGDADGWAAAALVNRTMGFGGFVRWRVAQLPVMAQWKMMGAAEYVCGLEPATNAETPTRRELRDRDQLQQLPPGADVAFRLEVGALPDPEAIAAFEAGLPG